MCLGAQRAEGDSVKGSDILLCSKVVEFQVHDGSYADVTASQVLDARAAVQAASVRCRGGANACLGRCTSP